VTRVTLYTGAGCHLCEVAREVLESVGARIAFELEEIRIDGEAELESRYRHELPVVLLDGVKHFKFGVDPNELEARLRART